MSRIYKTTEPFYLQGHGDKASTHIMMIHGFTGSPSEFRRLGYYLNDLGYTVDAMLLPGHGTSPEDMLKTGWNDWTGHVVDRYDDIQDGNGKRIIAIGHSMGGLLALRLSMERRVDGLVSLATPMFLTSRNTILAVLLQYVIKYIEKKPTVAQHIVEESCSYSKTPIPCVVDLRKLLKHVKSSLDTIRAPILVAQGERDGVVRPKSAAFIYDRVSSTLKQLAYYPQSSHAMLLDEEKERVFEDIHRFVVKVQQQTESVAGNDKGLVFS